MTKAMEALKCGLFDQQRERCAGCFNKLEITGLELDHIMPVALGGSDIATNFQLLCRTCNVRKRHKVERGAAHTLFDTPGKRRRKPEARDFVLALRLSATERELLETAAGQDRHLSSFIREAAIKAAKRNTKTTL